MTGVNFLVLRLETQFRFFPNTMVSFKAKDHQSEETHLSILNALKQNF